MRVAILGSRQFVADVLRSSERFPDLEFLSPSVWTDLSQEQEDSCHGPSAVDTQLDRLLSNSAANCDAIVAERISSVECAARVAESNCHLLTHSLSDVEESGWRRLSQAFQAAGRTLMCGHPVRYRPSHQSIKQRLEGGQLGDPGLLRIHRWQPNTTSTPPLWEDVVQELETACWMFSASPQLVFAKSTPAGAGADECDSLQLHLGFAGDGMALIDLNRQLPDGDSYYALSLIASTGAAYADDHHNMQLVYQGGPPTGCLTTESHFALTRQLAEFLAAISASRQHSIELMQDVVRTLVAIQRSIETGDAVKLES